MSVYPSVIDNIPQPGSGSSTTSPSHAGTHDAEIVAIEALETKVGTGSSTSTSGTVLRGNGTGTSQWAQANLTTDVTGTLPVANGGTGATAATGTGNVVLANTPSLTNPAFSSITNTGTLTLPSSTDTLVGRATTDTLTNKSMDGGSNTFTNLGTGVLATNAVQASQLATSAIMLGYTPKTTNFTTTSSSAVQVTGLTVTVTIPSGGRSIKITAFAESLYGNATAYIIMSIWDGTVGSGTQLARGQIYNPSTTNAATTVIVQSIVTPSAGSKTYNVGLLAGAGTATLESVSNGPSFILVEAI